MSAVMEVMVCSVSIARVRTLSILEKRVANSAFADSRREREVFVVVAWDVMRVEMVLERSS